jgi:hypothetical protein
VSLGVCQDLDVEGFRLPLSDFAARSVVHDFRLGSVATFATAGHDAAVQLAEFYESLQPATPSHIRVSD